MELVKEVSHLLIKIGNEIFTADTVVGEILIGPDEKEGKDHWDKAIRQPNTSVFMWHRIAETSHLH